MYIIEPVSSTHPAGGLDCVLASFCYGPMRVRRLVDFPYVLVRLRCDACKRAGPTGSRGSRWGTVLRFCWRICLYAIGRLPVAWRTARDVPCAFHGHAA